MRPFAVMLALVRGLASMKGFSQLVIFPAM